ncbi:MAG: sensor histidine kinase, partial [Flammeovirgaceae bacterium]
LEIRNTNLMPVETDLASELALAQNTLAKEILVSGARVLADFTDGRNVVTIQAYVQNIFLTLLDNAIKYRDLNKQLEVRVTARSEGGYLCINFSDNGLGIDTEQYGGKLFNLYARFHPEIEGKGMGLFLVKMQLEAMGGRISVESVVGLGTTFTLYFKKEK